MIMSVVSDVSTLLSCHCMCHDTIKTVNYFAIQLYIQLPSFENTSANSQLSERLSVLIIAVNQTVGT